MDEINPIQRLTRDLKKASETLSDREARYLVDAYYTIQGYRKRAGQQVEAMMQEPHTVLNWLFKQNETLEAQIKRALDAYSDAHPVGSWLKSIYGIGPVIASGLLAHIDITKAPTYGHIHSFAGLNPSKKWEKGQKRPWNNRLKVLCWHAGQSFMKLSFRDECFYGKLYREQKAKLVSNNESGAYAETASALLEKFKRETKTREALLEGKLSAAHIDARARRYVVKLFLSHLHLVWYYIHFGVLPPIPFPIAHQNHADFILPPNLEEVSGLAEAIKAGWRASQASWVNEPD